MKISISPGLVVNSTHNYNVYIINIFISRQNKYDVSIITMHVCRNVVIVGIGCVEL